MNSFFYFRRRKKIEWLQKEERSEKRNANISTDEAIHIAAEKENYKFISTPYVAANKRQTEKTIKIKVSRDTRVFFPTKSITNILFAFLN